MKEFNEWQCRIILAIIHNGNIEELLYGNHTLDDLMFELHSLEATGYIKKEDNTYKTTDLGKKILVETNKNKKGIYKYVYEDKTHQMERLGIDAIYIPRKRGKKDN